jgi:hypothetical protein
VRISLESSSVNVIFAENSQRGSKKYPTKAAIASIDTIKLRKAQFGFFKIRPPMI